MRRRSKNGFLNERYVTNEWRTNFPRRKFINSSILWKRINITQFPKETCLQFRFNYAFIRLIQWINSLEYFRDTKIHNKCFWLSCWRFDRQDSIWKLKWMRPSKFYFIFLIFGSSIKGILWKISYTFYRSLLNIWPLINFGIHFFLSKSFDIKYLRATFNGVCELSSKHL